MSAPELDKIKERLLPYIDKVYHGQEMDMIFFMLTDIMNESTELLCCGKGIEELVEEAFKCGVENGERAS